MASIIDPLFSSASNFFDGVGALVNSPSAGAGAAAIDFGASVPQAQEAAKAAVKPSVT